MFFLCLLGKSCRRTSFPQTDIHKRAVTRKCACLSPRSCKYIFTVWKLTLTLLCSLNTSTSSIREHPRYFTQPVTKICYPISLTRVLHSIICCRILLHIRTAAASHNRGLSSNTAISRGSTSTMRFKGVKRLISPFFTESSGSRTYMNTSGTSASAPVENIALRPLPPHHRRTQSVPLDSFSMPNIQTPARGYLRRHSDADYGMYESWDVR